MTDRFELLEQLGKGGMGTVWKARDRQTGEVVALKLLHEQFATDPAFVARFEREVDITRRIDSPHVVAMLEYGLHAGKPFAAMEFVPGESLRHRLRRAGPMSWPETTRILRQVANGLDAAHSAGIIHRDVKPSNILVGADGRAKLVDFGIAKAADMTALTGSSTTMGTAAYTAPEGESTAAADMYALGCTAYEMLSGQQPFTGDTPAQVLIKHLRDAPDLSRLPSEARDLVGMLMNKDPNGRLSNAAFLGVILEPEPSAPVGPAQSGRESEPVRGGSNSSSPPEADNVALFQVSITGRRFASAFVDYLSLLAFAGAAVLLLGDTPGTTLLGSSFCFICLFLWESGNGKSPGKWLFRLLVVGPDGDPLTVPRSLARTALKFLSIILIVPGLIDIIVIIATHGSQRLSDKITNTEVIRLEDAEDVDA